MRITVQGEAGVHAMLRDYMAPKLPARLQAATKAGANVFKAPLKEAARPLSKRMARAVTVKRAARERPASIVTFRRKVAFFAPWVIGGTKDHGPRKANSLAFQGKSGFVVTKRVRGVQPHPIVERVFQAHREQAGQAIDRALDQSEST